MEGGGADGEFLLDVLPIDGGPPKRPRRGVTWESVLSPIEADVASSGPSKAVRELLLAAGYAERREPLLTTLRLQSVGNVALKGFDEPLHVHRVEISLA